MHRISNGIVYVNFKNVFSVFRILDTVGCKMKRGTHYILTLFEKKADPVNKTYDRLCGLVVRVPGYTSRGPGSIPDATRLSEKLRVFNGAHAAS
jgi:hypothetical protein